MRLDPERRRGQLIDATVAVLAETGYESASVNGVARYAGVSKGLMWRYFTDRDDLMEQTASRTLTVVRDAVAADIDFTAPAPDVVRAAIRRAAGLLATHSAELTALREIRSNRRLDFEEIHQGEELVFRRGQSEGTLDPGADVRLMTIAYHGAVEGMLTYLGTHPEADADAYASGLAELLLRGFQNPQ